MPKSWIVAVLCISSCLSAGVAFGASPTARPALSVRSVDDELVGWARDPRLRRPVLRRGGPAQRLSPESGGRRSRRQEPGREVRVLQGDYEFERLLAWRRSCAPSSACRASLPRRGRGEEPGRGRYRLPRPRAWTATGWSAAPRGRRPARGGRPPEAAPLRDRVGVRDKLRPVPGGTQIVFSNFLCTLGFNALPQQRFGFVVNSHCTNVRGEVDGTRYSQSLPASGAIGVEIADPASPRTRRARPAGGAASATPPSRSTTRPAWEGWARSPVPCREGPRPDP